jgi:hypothetical protein
MDTSEQRMDIATTSKTMDTNNDHQDNIFMKLPAELRINTYERVFNASLDNISEKDPLDLSHAKKAMLRTLHIDRTIRYESRDICIELANRHIKSLEARLAVDNTARVNMPDLSEFAPSFSSLGRSTNVLLNSVRLCRTMQTRPTPCMRFSRR